MHISLISAVLFAVASARARSDSLVVNCAPLTVQRSDPFRSQGVPAGHVHVVVGGNAFSRNMSVPNAALQSTKTTCDKKTDNSLYWAPQLYHQNVDGSFEIVRLTDAAIYYFNRACDYTTDLYCDKNKTAQVVPDGFRMNSGDPMRRVQNASDITHRAVNYTCVNDDESHEVYGIPTAACKLLRARIFFPSCWDGVNIDSTDFRTHVSYPTAHSTGDFDGGVCPQSHPVGILGISYEFVFDTSKYGANDLNGNERLVFSNGDATGFGFHAAFMMGWKDRSILQNAYDDCDIGGPCIINTAGSSADYPPTQGPQTLLVPAPYEEDIGINGNTIAKLPGNNPVQTGPSST